MTPESSRDRSGWRDMLYALLERAGGRSDPGEATGFDVEVLKRAVDELPEDERLAVVHHFGLSGEEARAMDEVGRAVGCPAFWAARLCSTALDHLLSSEPVLALIESIPSGQGGAL